MQRIHTTQHQKSKPIKKNGQRIWIDNFPKKTYRWPADSEWSIWRYWTSLIIGETQTIYLIRYLQRYICKGLIYIYVCVCYIYIYTTCSSPTDEHISCYHTLAVVNIAAITRDMCTAVCVGSVVSNSSWPHGLARQTPLSMNPSGKNIGVGCHAFLQEIFQTQGLNPGLPHCRQILYCVSYPGSPVKGHVSFQISAFVFFRKVRRSGIARSYGRSVCDVLGTLHAVFHSGCANCALRWPFLNILTSSCATLSFWR